MAQYAGHNAIVLDGRLVETPYIDYTSSQLHRASSATPRSRAEHGLGLEDLALVLQTGALPVTFQRLAQHRGLGDARQGLAEPGQKAAVDRTARRRDLPALLYRFLGLVAVARPRDLRGVPVRGDPPLPRDADAAGFRGADPHDRSCGRRERRHLRTHQGRGARGQSVRAAIAAGYAKGFHTIVDANVVTVITALVLFAVAGAGEGLRPDAPDRDHDLAGHRCRRDARDAGDARRLLVVQQPALHGRPGAAEREVAADRLHAPPLCLVRDLGRDHPRRRSSRSAYAGLNLGIDFKGGSQLTLQDARAAHDRRRSPVDGEQGYADAVIQGRGTATARRLHELPGPDEGARPATSRRRSRARFKDRLQTTAPGAKTVSSSFGRQIARAAISRSSSRSS